MKSWHGLNGTTGAVNLPVVNPTVLCNLKKKKALALPANTRLTEETMKRKISRAARKRMATAGALNLAAYRAKQAAERQDVAGEAELWARDLTTELGGNPSAKQRALIHAATVTYGCVSLVLAKLRKTRVKDSDRLLERCSFLVGNLDRLLRRLELPAKPRPRTLADLDFAKVAPNSPILAPNTPFSSGK